MTFCPEREKPFSRVGFPLSWGIGWGIPLQFPSNRFMAVYSFWLHFRARPDISSPSTTFSHPQFSMPPLPPCGSLTDSRFRIG